MRAESFQTIIPQTGIVHIPQHILQDFAGHLSEIIIQEVTPEGAFPKIRSLRGKYRHALSSTEELSHQKAIEKELEL
jgi:predicted Rdx family selenoprotein